MTISTCHRYTSFSRPFVCLNRSSSQFVNIRLTISTTETTAQLDLSPEYNCKYSISKMMFYTQFLLLITLGHLTATQAEKSYLRRRANEPQTEMVLSHVTPLTAADIIQFNPSKEKSSGSGITLSESALNVNDSVKVNFEFISSNQIYKVDIEPANVKDWSVGIFMHMSNPQGGDLSPIVSMKPSIEYMGKKSDVSFNIEGGVTFSSDTVHLMQGSDPNWPLNTLEYGTAYDVWLLDQNGAAIVGPEWFTLESVEEIKMNQFVASETPLHALAIHGHADRKQKPPVEEMATPIKTSFALTSDKTTYESDDKIKVSYRIGEPLSTGSSDNDKLIRFDPPAAKVASRDSLHHHHDNIFDSSNDVKYSFGHDLYTSPEVKVNTPQYTIGIWMKMARPQGGELEPIVSVPIHIKEGTVQFDAMSLDATMHGTGFDAWIVDENGAEVYGPIFFSIPDQDD